MSPSRSASRAFAVTSCTLSDSNLGGAQFTHAFVAGSSTNEEGRHSERYLEWAAGGHQVQDHSNMERRLSRMVHGLKGIVVQHRPSRFPAGEEAL